MSFIYCFDPTANDEQSKVRGVGRYLQILKENFPDWRFTSDLSSIIYPPAGGPSSIFVNPFFNLLQPPIILKRIARKQIAVIHDLIPLKYPSHFPIGIKGKFNTFLNKIALKSYDLVVTDSEASKKDIMRILGLTENKVKVIYPCLPRIFSNLQSRKGKILNSQSNSDLLALNSKFCLYVGDATWNKNLVNLARAIKEINVTCVFIGKVFERAIGGANEVTLREADSGFHRRASQERRDHERQNLSRAIHPWQKELQQFLEETKNDKRFIFAGYVPDSELIKFYQQATVNVLPSRDEGFGFSYLEAASQACPSILADIPILHEISGNQGCIFADPNEVSALANAIGELYFRKVERNRLGFEAQGRSKFFSSPQFKKAFNKALNFDF